VAIQQGTAADAGRLLALFDDAVAWLVARGQTGQWGSGTEAGAIVLGEAHDYVPPPTVPELYVQVLLTAASHRNRGVGARLCDHAADLARARHAEQLRVDCWAGVDALPAAYERLGFTRTGSFDVNGWPGAILVRPL
jgi:GNAT superfamily N-acetyltransferase